MVEERLNLEPEVQKIFEYIDSGNNFLLSGGAGSGKTYSLVQVIRQVIVENPSANIACITYTNAAIREIESRVNHKNLSVATIHDFLWSNIKSYQRELKSSLVDLINSDKIKHPGNHVEPDYFLSKDIQYKEYDLIREGIISHDDMLKLAHHMYITYPKLCDILKDTFKFIFIDEYQDTSPLVIEIVLKTLQKSQRKNIIGFFGDAMQSIYDDSIGDLKDYINEGLVQEVKKGQNRRNPRLVYELANKIRTDGLVQRHSDDITAPNMKNGIVKEGCIKFYYSTADDKRNFVRNILGWDFDDTQKNKELMLTHNLIAQESGFKGLMEIYDADKILEYKAKIIEHIKKSNIADDFSESTFGEVIEKLGSDIKPTAAMKDFINRNPELYEQAKNYPFEEFRKIYIHNDALLSDKKEADDEKNNQKGLKRDDLIRHLFKIQTNLSLYRAGEYNEFLRKTEFKIASINDKIQLQSIILELEGKSDFTIEEVIDYADKNGICRKDDRLLGFIEKNKYVYERVKNVLFKEFESLFNFLEGHTPFSTQHKVKGAEFDNVLVVLDNGKWSKYNFQYLFENNGKESVRDRTHKLFYVCCTRSKENLIVYYNAPTQAVLDKAKEWFGNENVISV